MNENISNEKIVNADANVSKVNDSSIKAKTVTVLIILDELI